MELSKKTVRTIIGLIVLTLLLAAGLQKIGSVWGAFNFVIGLVFPFILGACLAFLLNIPMSVIERHLFSENRVKGPKMRKLARPLSLVLALLLVLMIIVIVIFIIVPAIADTVVTLTNSVPGFIDQVQKWSAGLAGSYPDIAKQITNLSIDWGKFGAEIIDFLQKGVTSFVGSTFNVASSIASGVVNFSLGFIFALYVLLQKEKLGSQFRKLFYAYLPERVTDKLLEVCRLSNSTFSSFVTGQCTEAVILGAMFVVVMLIFRLPYALMIGVLIGFLSLIPIFGAFIGCFVGAFLILMVNPMQAFWFIVIFLIIQQIEGNLIYPHVVGGSVGLPSIWVLVAVTIGGGAMGITGMIITIPLCSVCYTLLREATGKRLSRRRVPEEKYRIGGEATLPGQEKHLDEM